METLTLQQAISEGYTHFGYTGRDYQSVNPLEDITEDDFKDDNIVLFEKKPFYLGIDADNLRDIVTDTVIDNGEIADDTDEPYDLLRDGVNWEKFAEEINDAMRHRPYWRLTKIKLVP
jgi:hypothetical protein